jgi:hypothetical protein
MNIWKALSAVWNDKRFKHTVWVLSLLLIVILTLVLKRGIIFILLLLLVNAVIGLLMRPLKQFSVGIELGILTTVLCTFAYGWKVGMIAGLIALLVKLFFEGSFSVYNTIIVISHVFVAIGAGVFSGGNITAVGMSLVVFHNIFTAGSYFFFFGAPPHKIMVFMVTNIPWNLLMFTAIAPGLLGMMV